MATLLFSHSPLSIVHCPLSVVHVRLQMNICVYIYQDVFPILLHLPETTHLHNTSKLLLSLVFSLSLPPALLTRCSLTTHSLLTRFSLFAFPFLFFCCAHDHGDNERKWWPAPIIATWHFQCFSHYPRSTTTSKSGIRDVYPSVRPLQWVDSPTVSMPWFLIVQRIA